MDSCVAYGKMKGILMIASRDIVMACQVNRDLNGAIFCTFASVEHDDYPITEAPVRAEIVIGGWLIVPTEPGKCHCVYVSEADPKGKIPKFIIKQGIGLAAGFCTGLRKYMEKKEPDKIG